MAKSKKNGTIPSCPGNPEDYVLVNSREGPHWRKKRGTDKPAKLNTVFKNNVKLTGVVSPVASYIKRKLSPFINELETGRFVANVSGLLKKGYNKTGKLDFLQLKGYELQPRYKLSKLLRRNYEVYTKKNEVIIEISLGENAVVKFNGQVTGYYFEAILLYGDLKKINSLRIDSEVSSVYDIELKTEKTCRLSLILPTKKASWMLMLKLSSVFGDETGNFHKHFGMKVVWAESA
jgi:hypothetical protein